MGFGILGLRDPEWKLAAVDTQTHGGERFVAVAYERGDDYVTISQEPLGTKPPLPQAKPVTVRGLPGEIVEMNPVLLVRWEERGVSILVSTDLPREQALILVGRLQPVP